MLTGSSQLNRFALNRGVPHVRSTYWNQKVHAIVHLKNGEDLVVVSIGKRVCRLIRRIELILEAGGGEELCNASKICQW